MDYIAEARAALDKSRKHRNPQVAQSHALDSIAASLLHIAENMKTEPPMTADGVELIMRRMLDENKMLSNKISKAKKK